MGECSSPLLLRYTSGGYRHLPQRHAAILIVAGSLVGSAGIILTQIMCKAMNRSLTNVLFSGFGSGKTEATEVEGEIKPISAEDAYYVLEAASSVAIMRAKRTMGR